MQITHSKKIGQALSALAKRKQLKVAKDMGVWWTCLTRINQINDLIETLGFRYGNLMYMVYGTALVPDHHLLRRARRGHPSETRGHQAYAQGKDGPEGLRADDLRQDSQAPKGYRPSG